MDGVKQDFVVEQAPAHVSGRELVVKLAVTGAQVEAPYGVRLVLANSGRKIAYSRLRVSDATGKELPARIEVELTAGEPPALSMLEMIGHDDQITSLVAPSAASPRLNHALLRIPLINKFPKKSGQVFPPISPLSM
jgi:hypothetical protein